MRRPPSHKATLALCLFMSACATPQQRASEQESLLAAAGFTAEPANTPDHLASLRALPPNKVVPQDRDGSVRYVYTDPLICSCLYFGDQAAYGRYDQEMAKRQLARDQADAAQLKQSTWDERPP